MLSLLVLGLQGGFSVLQWRLCPVVPSSVCFKGAWASGLGPCSERLCCAKPSDSFCLMGAVLHRPAHRHNSSAHATGTAVAARVSLGCMHAPCGHLEPCQGTLGCACCFQWSVPRLADHCFPADMLLCPAAQPSPEQKWQLAFFAQWLHVGCVKRPVMNEMNLNDLNDYGLNGLMNLILLGPWSALADPRT